MSVLIDLSQATQRLSLQQEKVTNFPYLAKEVLSNQQFQLKHFSFNNDKNLKNQEILAIIGKSSQTFIRDMEWRFYMLPDQLRIKIKFFNRNRQNFLRAQTQRIKLELMILLRKINQNMSSNDWLIINPANNLLEFHFKISWKQYRTKITRIQSLRRFFIYLLRKTSQFEQVIYFCQPQILPPISQQQQKKLHLFDEFHKTINNFKFIMRNTIKMRRNNNQHINKMHQLKQYQPTNQIQQKRLKQQFDHVKILFQKNINQLYKCSLGFQKNQENQEIYNKCINKIAIHQNFKDKNNIQPKQKVFDTDPENKIVYGIKIAKFDKEKLISKEGGHSQITRAVFVFRLVKSIDQDVIKEQPNRWLIGTERKTQLTVKRCNYTNQASKNSFMNELYFLNYVRDFHSSFIGKYYLEMKNFRQRTQKDPIYMKSYFQNVDYVVRKCSTLSIKDRLSLLYRISLGLCFLSSKNVIHRDLKPQNIVVNSAYTPHIIDFGSCCSVYGSNSFSSYDKRLLTTKFIHIYYHQIPQKYQYIYEKMSRQQYEQHPLFDIYSFGRTICFIMFGTLQPPHYDQVAQGVYTDLLKNLIFLIQMCLNIDPDDRPGFGQVTGFLGSLSKFYTTYQQYFQSKLSQNNQKRAHSQPKMGS